MEYIQRLSQEQVQLALEDTPVVIITGPRQAGKSTLARQMTDNTWGYLDFDDEVTLSLAKNDPIGLFEQHKNRLIIDGVQRAPELFRTIKMMVDRARQPGKLLGGMFVLTGSANILALPRLSDSLAGRSEIVRLLPFSQAELRQAKATFLDDVFQGGFPDPSGIIDSQEIVDIVLAGGFPEAVLRTEPGQYQRWHKAYIQSIIQRDIKDIWSIQKADTIPKLISLLAARSGQLLNQESLSKSLGIDRKTVDSYITSLEQIFLVQRLKGWHSSEERRLIKRPKVFFLDSGLLASELKLTQKKVKASIDRTTFGHVLETFVFSELIKQAGWRDNGLELTYFRDKNDYEVDFVLESVGSSMVGVEVKAASTLDNDDFKGLRKLRELAGNQFKLGVVLYTGPHIARFGEGMYGLPISCLWS